MSFKIGDKVKCVKSYVWVEKGLTGVVVHITNGHLSVGVHWDNEKRGHSCQNHIQSDYGGYYVGIDNLELIDGKPKKEKKTKPLTEKQKIEKGIKLYHENLGKDAKKWIERKENEIKSFTETKENFIKEIEKLQTQGNSDPIMRHIKYHKMDIKNYNGRIVATKKDLRKYMRTLKNLVAIKEIKKDIEKLKNHKCFVGIEYDDNEQCFRLYTQPLKALEENIGHYNINIYVSERRFKDMRINNSVKSVGREDGDNRFDHWCVENGYPCFGNWHDVIFDYFNSGNFYLMADSLIIFLTNVQELGGHFTTRKWIELFTGKAIPPEKETKPEENIREEDTRTIGIPIGEMRRIRRIRLEEQREEIQRRHRAEQRSASEDLPF